MMLFTLLLSTVIFIGCSKQNDESKVSINETTSVLRSQFLKDKNQDEIVISFRKLDPIEKTNLWVEKLNQLISSDLPKEHKILLSKLKIQIQQNNNPQNLEKFRNTLIELANITPMEDFCLMVEKLDDYKFTGEFIGRTKLTSEILYDLENLGNQPKILENSTNTTSKIPACNCRYSCSLYGGSSGSCRETVDGCGPFGLSTCNGHI